jgi:hypothetical protein
MFATRKFSEGLLSVQLNGKWGLINETGKEILSCRYDKNIGFGNLPIANVQINGKYGIIDKNGKEIVPCKYDKDISFSDGFANVQIDGKYGIVDKNGKEVVSCKYDERVYFSRSGINGGFADVQINGKHGLLNRKWKEIAACQYDKQIDFNDNYHTSNPNNANVLRNGKHGVMDTIGTEIIPCLYDYSISFDRKGFADIQTNGKYGLINKNGKEIVACQYDERILFDDKGFANVKMNGKYGLIDTTGTVIISCLYDYNISFDSQGFAEVQTNRKYGLFNKNGKEIAACQYDDRIFFDDKGFAKVKMNEKCGLIDITGAVIISCLYDRVEPFNNKGLAEVRLGKDRKYLDKMGNLYDDASFFQKEQERILKQPFSEYAQSFVGTRINEWQKKGEFEKKQDWEQRVTEKSKKAKAIALTKEAEQSYLAWAASYIDTKLTLEDYDIDNETFQAQSPLFGNLLIPVPVDDAPSFKTMWNSLQQTPKYFIENDKCALADMTFTTPNGKSYKYSNKASLKYQTPQIDYSFASIDVKEGEQKNVDIDIPMTGVKNTKTFAVIISNENYKTESKVEFASHDGTIFKEYCIKTLGLPQNNVHFVANASLNEMRREINWISQVIQAYNGEANVLFYYAGHGIPDESSKTSYLLPIDGYGSDVTTGYKLEDLYSMLGNLPTKSVVVFLDACFSGSQRSGDMLASARGIAIKAQQGKPSGNMVVFSAAQGDETAYPYKEKEHGLFTYFLLKKLQESKGDVTFEELSNYLTTNVRQQSIVINSKSQTPTVTPSISLGESWKKKKLK